VKEFQKYDKEPSKWFKEYKDIETTDSTHNNTTSKLLFLEERIQISPWKVATVS
jgi:hypothetical protein